MAARSVHTITKTSDKMNDSDAGGVEMATSVGGVEVEEGEVTFNILPSPSQNTQNGYAGLQVSVYVYVYVCDRDAVRSDRDVI